MSVAPEKMTVRSILESRARKSANDVFAIAPETGCQLSFSELLARSHQVDSLLAEKGILAGGHVGMFLPNGLTAVQTFVGVMASGRVVVPLSLLAKAEQLSYVIEHADCDAIFVANEFVELLQQALAAVSRPVEIIAVDPDFVESAFETSRQKHTWSTSKLASKNPALLMYTSGTTGRPKGVILSHRNIVSGARFVSASHALSRTDRVLAVLPLYHINAQIVTVLAPLLDGGSLVMPRRFSAQSFWQLANGYRCTWLNVVPTIIAILLHESPGHPANPAQQIDRSRLRFCRSASAPLPPAHQRAFEERFGLPVVETLGMTETAAPVFANRIDVARRKIGSPGQAFGNEAKIIDPATGHEIADGIVGEIVVRGPNVTAGYYKAPEETRKAFTEEGWLHTGDLGYRDADGFFFITGRLKELIIKGGENIAPREIDEVLLSHPEVLEAASVGVADELYGQEILAGIVLRPGSQSGERELTAYCRERLGKFKSPRYFRFLAELPKGPSGKVQRIRLLDI